MARKRRQNLNPLELEKLRKSAIATRLGINPDHILETHSYPPEKRLMVIVNIFHRGLEEFVLAYNPPFAKGDLAIPHTVPTHPRYGNKGSGLTDKRRRTVERVEFDRNTLSWWVWLKGKQFPFAAHVLYLAPAR